MSGVCRLRERATPGRAQLRRLLRLRARPSTRGTAANEGKKLHVYRPGSWQLPYHEAAYPMCYIGLARGSAPSTPARRYGGAAAAETTPPVAAVAGPRAGTIRSAGRSPASRGHTQPRLSTRWRGSSADAAVLRMTPRPTVREGCCGPAGRLARPPDEQAKRLAQLRCRGAPDPRPHRPQPRGTGHPRAPIAHPTTASGQAQRIEQYGSRCGVEIGRRQGPGDRAAGDPRPREQRQPEIEERRRSRFVRQTTTIREDTKREIGRKTPRETVIRPYHQITARSHSPSRNSPVNIDQTEHHEPDRKQ